MKIANTLRRQTKVRSLFLGAVLSISAISAQALDNFKEYHKGQLEVDLGTQFFYSEANYINMGSGTQNLYSGSHFQVLDFNFEARYVGKRHIGYFAKGVIGTSESKNSLTSVTRSNSTLSQAVLGIDFVLMDNVVQLVPEIGGLITTDAVNPNGDKALNSEGAYEIWAKLTAQKNLGPVSAYAWAGYIYRTENRSNLLPWGFGLQSQFSEIQLGGEVFGTQSISDDIDANVAGRSNRKSFVDYVDAGSYKFYYPNPSVVDSQVYAKWSINPSWALQVNGGATISGENTAAGYHVGAFMRFSFDPTKKVQFDNIIHQSDSSDEGSRTQRSRSYSEPELSSEVKVKNFKEDTSDGVDQSLFRASSVPKTKTVDDELQKQMDNTEMQIELKQKRKKKR